MKTTQYVRELADREAIRECLFRYSRAIDRRDRPLLDSVFWPDAVTDYGFFAGPVREMVDWAFEALATMDQTMHSMTNMLIDIELPVAKVETYYVAYHRRTGPDGLAVDQTLGGRYLDRMEKRDDDWRIADRHMVIDWMTENPASGDWAMRLPGVAFRTNMIPDDPSCRFFAGTRLG